MPRSAGAWRQHVARAHRLHQPGHAQARIGAHLQRALRQAAPLAGVESRFRPARQLDVALCGRIVAGMGLHRQQRVDPFCRHHLACADTAAVQHQLADAGEVERTGVQAAEGTRLAEHRATQGALQALRVTKSLRSEYDHLMLQLHDAMKGDMEYQRSSPQVSMPFPPGSVWVCFSDQATHAVMSGQYMMEQTLHLPASHAYDKAASPLAILTRLMGRPLQGVPT